MPQIYSQEYLQCLKILVTKCRLTGVHCHHHSVSLQHHKLQVDASPEICYTQ